MRLSWEKVNPNHSEVRKDSSVSTILSALPEVLSLVPSPQYGQLATKYTYFQLWRMQCPLLRSADSHRPHTYTQTHTPKISIVTNKILKIIEFYTLKDNESLKSNNRFEKYSHIPMIELLNHAHAWKSISLFLKS